MRLAFCITNLGIASFSVFTSGSALRGDFVGDRWGLAGDRGGILSSALCLRDGDLWCGGGDWALSGIFTCSFSGDLWGGGDRALPGLSSFSFLGDFLRWWWQSSSRLIFLFRRSLRMWWGGWSSFRHLLLSRRMFRW